MSRCVTGVNDLASQRPDLVAQLVDPSQAPYLSVNSNRKVAWRCEQGHEWDATVVSRSNGSRCPYCAGKKVLPGFNDAATTCPGMVPLFANKDDSHKVTARSNKTVRAVCPDCGLERDTKVGQLYAAVQRGKTGCPYCDGKKVMPGFNDMATTAPELATQLVDPSLATQITARAHKDVEWRCERGHVWTDSPLHRSYGVGCPVCANRQVLVGDNDISTTHPELADELADQSLRTTLVAGSNTPVEWICSECGHHWVSKPVDRVRQHSGCPVCTNRVIIPGVNDLATVAPDIAAELTNPEDGTRYSIGSDAMVNWTCAVCGKTWDARVRMRTMKQSGCPHCFNQGRSYKEDDLVSVLENLLPGEQIVRRDRTVLGGLELDVLIPRLNLAVEFNGLYWHSDDVVADPARHEKKYRKCAEQGIQLIQVWEDDWDHRREVVIRMLAAKCGATNQIANVMPHVADKAVARIGARCCEARVISGSAAEQFLAQNHIQGGVRASLHCGLFDAENQLRAVLSVRNARNNARSRRQPGEWDVQRYATLGIVPGGFSKLLKFATEEIMRRGLLLTRWISFSSNDVSDGAMYASCGFTMAAELKADYKYVGKATHWMRTPKEAFQKKRFKNDPELKWDAAWTERECAVANQLYRVYDAGKVRWVKEV